MEGPLKEADLAVVPREAVEAAAAVVAVAAALDPAALGAAEARAGWAAARPAPGANIR